MIPLEVLGKPFGQVKDLFPNSGILEIYDSLPEGDAQEYYVADPKKRWEFLLMGDNIVAVIFLYLSKGYEEFGGLDHQTSRAEVLEKYGTPTFSAEQRESPLLGRTGAWERYDFHTHAMHIQHCVDSDKIDKVTLMIPSAAP